jgi:hypothetical protein
MSELKNKLRNITAVVPIAVGRTKSQTKCQTQADCLNLQELNKQEELNIIYKLPTLS